MHGPFRFRWQIKDQLAGMARPFVSVTQDEPDDLTVLKDAGITAIVSLTMTALDGKLMQKAGFRYRHIPVADFTAPAIEQVESFVAFVDQVVAEGGAAVVHCAAGCGRTGTMLACYLVHCGETTENAVRLVREKEPGSIETVSQETLIRHYYQTRCARSTSPNAPKSEPPRNTKKKQRKNKVRSSRKTRKKGRR